jgi:hypothetical protein
MIIAATPPATVGGVVAGTRIDVDCESIGLVPSKVETIRVASCWDEIGFLIVGIVTTIGPGAASVLVIVIDAKVSLRVSLAPFEVI